MQLKNLLKKFLVAARNPIEKIIGKRKRSKILSSKVAKVSSSKISSPVKIKPSFAIFIFVIIFLLIAFVIGFSRFVSLKPKLFLDNSATKTFVDNKEINIAFIYVENDETNNYHYIDGLAIASFNIEKGEIKIYAFNPNVVLNTKNRAANTLKALINNSTTAENIMGTVKSTIEDYSGIRVDRYILQNKSQIRTYAKDTGIAIKANQTKKLNSKVINKGDSVSGEDLVDYLFTNLDFTDNQTESFLNLTTSIINSTRDLPQDIKFVYNNEFYLNLFYTDLSRDELFLIIRNANQLQNSIKGDYYRKVYCSNTDDDINGKSCVTDEYQVTNISLLSESLAKLFTLVEIQKEQASIEVFNATNITGFAVKKKRAMENLGMNVIKFGNYPDKVEGNVLYIPNSNPEKFINTINSIKRNLRNDVKIINGNYRYNYSGDLLLILGE